MVQQVYNALAVRQVLPKGPNAMELHWTYLGFADDTPEMRQRRLRQGTWSARPATSPWRTAAWAASCSAAWPPRRRRSSVINMGGEGAESQDTRATEAAVRGFWKAYRRYMGF